MIESYLPYILITIGMLNLIVLYYFRYVVNNTIRVLGKILLLNKENNYDIEILLKNIGPLLDELEIDDYGYHIVFLKQVIDYKEIKNRKNRLMENIYYGDYHIIIEIAPKRYIGENKDKYDIVLKALKIIIQENLLIKSETINKSFLNISKFHTFILHDTKNIAQFFQTLHYNIEQAKTQEEKNHLLEYLKASTETLNYKSSKILKMLEINSSENMYQEKSMVSLKTYLEGIIAVYSMDLKVNGDYTLYQNETLLYFIFDNIIKNIEEKKQKQKDLEVIITITKVQDGVTIEFFDNGTPIDKISKIFEPFYTTKIDGLGIGLYKIKTLLHQINGEIEAKNHEKGVSFDIFIKQEQSIES